MARAVRPSGGNGLGRWLELESVASVGLDSRQSLVERAHRDNRQPVSFITSDHDRSVEVALRREEQGDPRPNNCVRFLLDSTNLLWAQF